MAITPIQIKQDIVTKIASSSNSILIERQFKIGQQMSWLKVVKIAGSSSPSVSEMNNNGVEIFQLDPAKELINSTVLVDVYVMCNDGDAPGEYGKIVVWDDYQLSLNPLGGVDVNIQDQTTPPIDLYFSQVIGAFSTLSVDAAIDDLQVTVTDDTSIVVGKFLGIFSTDEDRFYFGTVLAKPGSNVITLDTPLDFAFSTGDNVAPVSSDMNVNGSATSQIFQIRGGGPASTLVVDITRIIIEITTTDPPEFSDFGDIALGLTNGIVLRRNNGSVNNIFNAKTNAELANLMYDLTTFDETKQFNVNGIIGRMTFAGQDKHGVAIRLMPGDTLDLIIQDALQTLLSFRIIAQGHVVD